MMMMMSSASQVKQRRSGVAPITPLPVYHPGGGLLAPDSIVVLSSPHARKVTSLSPPSLLD